MPARVGPAAWIAQVDTQAFLAAIVLDVKQAALDAKDGGVAAQVALGSRLDFDDIGAHLGQHATTGWPGQRARKVEHAQPAENVLAVLGRHRCLLSTNFSPPSLIMVRKWRNTAIVVLSL